MRETRIRCPITSKPDRSTSEPMEIDLVSAANTFPKKYCQSTGIHESGAQPPRKTPLVDQRNQWKSVFRVSRVKTYLERSGLCRDSWT